MKLFSPNYYSHAAIEFSKGGWAVSVSVPASSLPVGRPPPVLLNFRQFCMQSGFAAGALLLRPAQIRNPTRVQ